jgi:magnesium transporter
MVEQDSTGLSIIHYDRSNYSFNSRATLDDCRLSAKNGGVTWINVDSVTDLSLLQTLGSIFGLHDLTIQDIENTGHRVKYEDFSNYLLIMLKMLEYDIKAKAIDSEQLSVVFGANYVITFQERPGDFFGPLRDEIKVA